MNVHAQYVYRVKRPWRASLYMLYRTDAISHENRCENEGDGDTFWVEHAHINFHLKLESESAYNYSNTWFVKQLSMAFIAFFFSLSFIIIDPWLATPSSSLPSCLRKHSSINKMAPSSYFRETRHYWQDDLDLFLNRNCNSELSFEFVKLTRLMS